jgi:hypothetical protein
VAIFHLDIGRNISRGTGGSAVASAAYIARESYLDERTGQRYDYRPDADKRSPIQAAADHDLNRKYEEGKRLGTVAGGLAGPIGAPDWAFGARNSELAWNKAEGAEKRRDAQIAEPRIGALPKEMTLEEYLASEGLRPRDYEIGKAGPVGDTSA